MAKKHYHLPKRFSASLSEAAYARLRAINAETGLSNNYCLTVLLEQLDDLVEPAKLSATYRKFIDEHTGEH